MNHIIQTSDLTMRFRGCDALRGVTLNVDEGTVFALLGENGAGKTTLIRILTGFQMPTSGTCRVMNLDPAKDALEIRRRAGYVSDAPALYDWMGVGEIGWFAGTLYDKHFLPRYQESIRRYEIPEDRKIRHLSKGQRAKVALSLSLAHDPELLILDEPTSGLDPKVRRDFLESMIDRAASGRTVFLSSHQMAEVERVADVIAILHDGIVRVCEPLDTLKDSVIEVAVSLEDPLVVLPALPEPAEVLGEASYGRQRSMVIRHYDSGMHDLLASRVGVTGVSERTLSLEEIFIAFTGKSPPREAIDRAEAAVEIEGGVV
ncbi:ABC transporter ATP-binding protein YtrB [Stieleria maiorica]|uniref:ABC transporter ATP-binding protein YtrB n=2 Tax=Stieleria maiorica TaxID=2795974 RepID=A0A5B9MHS1_9BACT|nr:ABC transporter ATP-binding protein [Stieleria maiorica]QEF99540.1 ABC transporter ATP-binding protein YtrB [Stieleria maiorica]